MDLVDKTLNINWTPFWTWLLVSTRLIGVFSIIPAVGTNQIPIFARTSISIVIGVVFVFSGMSAAMPENMVEAAVMLLTEFILGFILGFVPSMIIGAVAVSGQVTTGAIGLGQANMMDPSLGAQVAILARIQSLIAGVVFLLINGHHSVIRAASDAFGSVGVGKFDPNINVVMLLIDRFSHAFELAVSLSAPILVTVLIANFVLGLITRFVSQVNIFIISLPLTIIMGLYITIYTTSGLVEHLIKEFSYLEDVYTVLQTLK